MVMSVDKLLRPRGPVNYHKLAFRRTLEDHIARNNDYYKAKVIPLEPRLLSKYNGDFYGLLIELGIPEEVHWFTLRVNGLHSTNDFNTSVPFIYAVNAAKVTAVLDRYLSTNSQL